MHKATVVDSMSLVLTGSGGAGVMTAGETLLGAAQRCGLYGLMTRSSGPQIRGGEAAALLRLANYPVESHADRFDILLALDFENSQRFAAEIPLDHDSLIVADSGAGEVPPAIAAYGARLAFTEIADMTRTIKGGRVSMIALGILAALIGMPEEALLEAVKATIGERKPEALAPSQAAVRMGTNAAKGLPHAPHLNFSQKPSKGRWSLTGNEATGYGAIKGGVRFVAGYPITPATEILEWMAPALQKCGGVLVQAEDELASINMIIGASHGGVPSLTATAGPGLSLMIESLGLAVASETPIVVVDVMRTGPSTGIATKSEQTDLNIAVYGLHGDAPHVVVAPLGISDCLPTTQWSIELAEAIQTPVLVLSDQSIGQSQAIIDRPKDVPFAAKRQVVEPGEANYRRYETTESGISPMTLPGTKGGQYTADGLEHNTRGTPSSQAQDHIAQLDKRQRKVSGYSYGDFWADVEGEGELAVITWGSSTQPVREAVKLAQSKGLAVKLIAMRLISPAQPEKLRKELEGVKRILVIEQSHQGQFWRYLRAHYDLAAEIVPIHRPGPLPIRPGEILSSLMKEAHA
jgi:2-oxoglutarate ferredoxin oxidoreductase subunit alpha